MLRCVYKIHGWKYILFPNVGVSARVEMLLLLGIFELQQLIDIAFSLDLQERYNPQDQN